MTDKLKEELPEILAEHKQIEAALEVLVKYATAEHPLTGARLAIA
jgi:hypothetical protein